MNRRLDSMAWTGLLCVLLSAILCARLVWEQTALSVQSGPQMVGFSLAHSGYGALLLLGPIAGIVWAIAVVVVAVRRKSWRHPVRLGLLGAFGVCILLMLVPYGFWQRLLVKTHAHGAYAGEFVSYAAAAGDLATVKSFVTEGVSVDVRNESSGATPLHGAAVAGQIGVIQYLLSKGADVNALNAYGDSPVQNALSTDHPDAVALLEAHGGKNIRGPDAQRDQAIKDQVARDLERVSRER
jgi:ankyrin repeat protein